MIVQPRLRLTRPVCLYKLERIRRCNVQDGSYLAGVLAAGSDCTLADVAIDSVNERGGDGSAFS